MNYFLLARHKSSGALDVNEFIDAESALQALRVREREAGPELEVVLFMAPDLRTLRATHPRFFPGAMQELLGRAS